MFRLTPGDWKKYLGVKLKNVDLQGQPLPTTVSFDDMIKSTLIPVTPEKETKKKKESATPAGSTTGGTKRKAAAAKAGPSEKKKKTAEKK